MKKIDYKLGIILTLIGLSVFQYFNPTIKEVEIVKEVEVTKTIIDSVYVDKIIEKKIYYPKYITKIEKDTVEIIKEVIVERPVTKIKKIYRDR